MLLVEDQDRNGCQQQADHGHGGPPVRRAASDRSVPRLSLPLIREASQPAGMLARLRSPESPHCCHRPPDASVSRTPPTARGAALHGHVAGAAVARWSLLQAGVHRSRRRRSRPCQRPASEHVRTEEPPIPLLKSASMRRPPHAPMATAQLSVSPGRAILRGLVSGAPQPQQLTQKRIRAASVARPGGPSAVAGAGVARCSARETGALLASIPTLMRSWRGSDCSCPSPEGSRPYRSRRPGSAAPLNTIPIAVERTTRCSWSTAPAICCSAATSAERIRSCRAVALLSPIPILSPMPRTGRADAPRSSGVDGPGAADSTCRPWPHDCASCHANGPGAKTG